MMTADGLLTRPIDTLLFRCTVKDVGPEHPHHVVACRAYETALPVHECKSTVAWIRPSFSRKTHHDPTMDAAICEARGLPLCMLLIDACGR